MRNRINNYGKSLWFGIVLLTLAACNDWLDVDPKSQVKDKDCFLRKWVLKRHCQECIVL